MGRPGLKDPAYHGSDDILQAAFSTSPSPTNSLDSLNLPHPKHSTTCAISSSQLSTPYDGTLDIGIVPAMPNEVNSERVMTPRLDDPVVPSMDALVGGALAPTKPNVAPSALLPKQRPGLRLPSFDQLGIAAPHPDRIEGAISPNARADTGARTSTVLSSISYNEPDITSGMRTMSIGLSSLEEDLVRSPGRGSGCAIQSPLQQYVNTITPPSEGNAPIWDTGATVQVAGLHSPSTDPGAVASSPDEIQAPSEQQSDPLVLPEIELSAEPDEEIEPSSWIDDAVKVLLQNLRTASRPTDSMKILSHALPSTSSTGHIFSRVINAIHVSTPVSPVTPLTWINVFHAIPGRFNLADLPTSPPATPGPPIGGDDYFTQKIFDSAVSVLDYQDDLTSLPRSPRPVVPPSSIDVSIVERYIPPSSSQEFAEMFEATGSSILLDRLLELSPDNGSLLFIYPTREGAQTFMKEYLGPVLDPLLRSMVVVNGLSSDLCISLGNMRAAHQLLDHDLLRQRIAMLCGRLTQGNTMSQRFHGRRPVFSLSYAAKKSVKLTRAVWAREWWTKQEKTRLKQSINDHFLDSQPRRTSINEFAAPQTSATVLLQQILDGVAGTPRQELNVPDHAIEVSVFVITRSS